ncbi:hypothetical protein PRIPAC_72866 [Pristionchus pacificus]|uniref:Uncharacterized protein n=1 Tax=Pristionchus pacificus TaxID=54126 RepID=A0A2A6BZX1_PRIPA|nr:hypothetical protein PRIPAC_72866 [Pristionchus pacificus]|eukprot:PDM71377.1 hypothetical protein PRIPAC_37784 [Pristionchus pacificus]
MRLFARSKTNNPKEISYEQVGHLIAVAGIVCKEKARKGKVNGISDVAHFTIRLIDSRVRTSWSHTGRSWEGCWNTIDFMIVDRAHRRPSSILPYSPFHPVITIPWTFYGKHMLIATAGVLGTITAYRIFKIIQATSKGLDFNTASHIFKCRIHRSEDTESALAVDRWCWCTML